MAAGGKQRDSRERARVYQARKAFHEGQSRRRTRDNVIAGIVGGVLILAVVGGQAAYFLAGPGAPTPAPSATTTPTPTIAPDPSATPTATPTAVPDPSASPTP